jgi:hypothetical protein
MLIDTLSLQLYSENVKRANSSEHNKKKYMFGKSFQVFPYIKLALGNYIKITYVPIKKKRRKEKEKKINLIM